MNELLKFRLQGLELHRRAQVLSAYQREMMARLWWAPVLLIAITSGYMIFLAKEVLWLLVACDALAFARVWVFPRVGLIPFPASRPNPPGWIDRRLSSKEQRVQLIASGLDPSSARRREVVRWAKFQAARITPQWIELWRVPRLVVLPRRAFSSEAAFNDACRTIRENVPLDPRMEAALPQVLALGDSYTIGESVPVAERWPVQLANRLREQDLADLAEPTIIAQTGWTTGELAEAIRARNPSGPFALVTLLIGVNNQYRGLASESFRKEFHSLLTTAVRLAHGKRERVIVLSIPDWGVTPFAEGRDRDQIAEDIETFNDVVFEEAEMEGVTYVDITEISRLAATDSGLVAEDGLHPSGRMYREWAESVLPKTRAALGA